MNPQEITERNFRFCRENAMNAKTAKQGVLLDFAAKLCGDGFSPEDLVSDEFRNRFSELTANSPFGEMTREEKGGLCCCIAEKSGLYEGEPGEIIASVFFGNAREETEGTTAYVRNYYTDRAFRRFSDLIPDLKVKYESDVKSACEDVYNGDTDYCILPLENAREGVLSGFRRMIETYDLKIILCCSVETEKEQAGVFGLIGRNASLPDTETDAQTCLRITVSPESSENLTDLLCVAEEFHLETESIMTVPDENTKRFDLVFSLQNANLPAFLVYLVLYVPRWNLLGIYSLLK